MPQHSSQTNSSRLRVAVIGGGLTGLSAAHRLTELAGSLPAVPEIVLFDSSSQPGGVTGTVRQDDWLIETGADSFITNKPWAVNLCRRLDIEDRLIPTDDRFRRSLVLRKGRPLAVPEGFMLMAPARVGPILRTRILSPWGKLRMGLEYLLPRGRQTDDESLASFVQRRFGRELFERLVQPLVGGIYTADPELLSLRATLPRFLDMERDQRSLIRATLKQAATSRSNEHAGSGARYGLFATPAGGISEITGTLADRLKDVATLRSGVTVTALRPPAAASATPRESRSCWQIETGPGEIESFDAVVLAIPAWRAAELVNVWSAELADQLRQIPYASSAVVVSGHRLEDVGHPLDAFGLVIPAIERRKVLAVSFASRKFPGRAPDGHVLLRTFVGGALQPELLERNDQELIELVQSELRDLLGVAAPPMLARVARYNRAMPQYHVGHLARVDQIDALTAGIPGLELAGNAYRGVGIPDCIHSGEQAAERLVAGLRET